MAEKTPLTAAALLARIVDTIGTKEITAPREAVALVVDSYLAALGFASSSRDDAFSSTYTHPQSDGALRVDISAPFPRINYSTYDEETAIMVTGRKESAPGDVETFATAPLQDLINSKALPWKARADASTADNVARLAELFTVRPPGASSLMQSSSATPSSLDTLLQGIQAYILQPLVPDLAAPGYTKIGHYGTKWPSYGTGVNKISENRSYGAFLTGKNIGDREHFQSLKRDSKTPGTASSSASKEDTPSTSTDNVRAAPPRDNTRDQARNEAEAAAAAEAFRRDTDSGPSLAHAQPSNSPEFYAPPDGPPPGRSPAAAAAPPTVDFAPPGFEDEHQMARTLGPRGSFGGGEPLSGTGHSDLHQPNMGPSDPLRRFLPGPGAGTGVGSMGVGGDSGLGVGPGGFSGMHPTFGDPLFSNNRPRPGFGRGGPPPGARYDDPMGDTNDELGGFGGPDGLGGPGMPGPRGPRGGFGGNFGGGFGGGFGSGGGGFGGFGGGGII